MANIVFDKDIEQAFSSAGTTAGANTQPGLLDSAKFDRTLSATSLGISALAEMGSAFSRYSQNSVSARFMRLQADNIGLQAEQTANQLREKLYGDIANSFAGYAARGVDVGSGTPMRNAELSLKEGGQDIQQIQKNAEMQSGALRAQADILKKGSTYEMFAGMANSLAKGFASAYSFFG